METFEKRLVETLVEISCNSLVSLHIDSIGFFMYPIKNDNKLSIDDLIQSKLTAFGKLLLEVEKKGGNIVIPTYSHSYNTDKIGIYDYFNSPSIVGYASEFLRKQFPYKRTVDPMFSYIVFSKNKQYQHFDFQQTYNSMGENSIMESLFNDNGMIISIGNVLHRMTEAHYLEKKINVYYRNNVFIKGLFFGDTITLKEQDAVVFGRNNVKVSNFIPILQVLKENQKYYEWKIDGFKLNGIKFKDLYYHMKIEYAKDEDFFICSSKEKNIKNRQNDYKIL